MRSAQERRATRRDRPLFRLLQAFERGKQLTVALRHRLNRVGGDEALDEKQRNRRVDRRTVSHNQ